MRGSVHLLLRQGVGNVIRFAGGIAMASLLGTSQFGIYGLAVAVAVPLGALVQIGLATHLTRRDDDPGKPAFDLLYTHNTVMGALIILVGVVAYVLFDGAAQALAFAGVFVALAVDLQGVPARVAMDRELRFGERGLVEVTADMAFYLVALPLAVLDFGFKAPVIGQIAQSSVMAGGLIWRSRYRPALTFDSIRWRVDVANSYGYALYDASIHAFDSALVLISGLIFGKDGAGVVTLAQRLANRTAVLRVAVDQVALASLSRVQRDPDRLKRAHSQGVLLHLLSTGVIIAGVGFTAPLLLPLMGDKWAPAIPILGLFCLFQLVSVAFDLHGNILRVTGRPHPTTIQRVLQFILTVLFALALARAFDDVRALGVAAALSTLSFLILERPVREIFIPSYQRYVPWFLALVPFTLTAFVSLPLRPLLFVPGFVLLALPVFRNDLIDQGKAAVSSLRSR